jgi:hypothetical protein
VGISRTHWDLNNVIADGVFTDKSNHGQGNIIVSVSGIEASINNVYVGRKFNEFSWSGLSHTSANFLWISLVEEPTSKFNYKSSRQFRDFDTRLTLTPSEPTGQEGSILVATYLSGVGINSNPYNKYKFVMARDHVNNNQNPHGLKLFVDDMLVSGITVLSPSIWDYQVASGAPSGVPFNNIKYLQNVTQYGRLITSGILGNILSGNFNFTLFGNITNLEADPANVGYLTVVSGMSISGSRFYNHINVLSGITTDKIDLTALQPLISINALSGLPLLHTHSLVISSGTSVHISPKYPGSVFSPPTVGLGSSNRFEYDFDLGFMKPTLRHKSAANSANGNLYVRTIMPTQYGKLESIIIDHKIDSGAKGILLKVRDAVGTLLTPRQGSVLSSSGTQTTVVSGISQSGFSQNLPFDLEFTFQGTSGTSHYLGDIVFNYRAT